MRLYHVLTSEFSELSDQFSNFKRADLENLCSLLLHNLGFYMPESNRGIRKILKVKWREARKDRSGVCARPRFRWGNICSGMIERSRHEGEEYGERAGRGKGWEKARGIARIHKGGELPRDDAHMCATATARMTDFTKMTADLEAWCAALPRISNRRPAWRESVRVRHASDEVGRSSRSKIRLKYIDVSSRGLETG